MMAVLQGRLQSARNGWVGQPAFGMPEPYAGKLARTVLRGVRGLGGPRAYSTGGLADRECK